MEERRSKVLIVDDEELNRELLEAVLISQYDVIIACDGKEALKKVNQNPPDIILLDVMMPGLDGYAVCKQLKDKKETSIIPIVMVTALKEKEDRIRALEVGADDFLSKPIDRPEVLARVKSLLRVKHLYDELTNINKTLEQRVNEQIGQIQRLSRLKQYFSPSLAEKLISDDSINQTKRKDLTIFFIDIRNFTHLSEAMEPEELLSMLNIYFTEMVQIIFKWKGTVGKFIGDGIMGFFGDPVECSDHAELAIKMGLEIQNRIKELNENSITFSEFPLHIGVGINTGYVTIGNIGPEHHKDYTVIGKHVNLAACLESNAKPGQVLISQRTYSMINGGLEVEEVGHIDVKGFDKPVRIYNVTGLSK